MTFLNPAILFGLFAASIPLLIHLLNLRKIKKVEFSTLAFLKEIQKTKIKKIKLKQWLLLLIRTLIIIFLVAAFARPTLESVSPGGISSAAKTSAVFILDNSLSMGYVTENGSYFNQAKQLIKNISAELHDGDDISLVTTTMQQAILTREKRLSHFIKKISLVDITDAQGNISNAIQKAEKLLSKSKNYNKEIYLITDLQKSNFTPKELDKIFSNSDNDKRTNFYVFDVNKGQTQNAGITGFVSINQIFALNKTIKFKATIENFSDNALNNDIISLFVNGKRTAQQSINLLPHKSKQIFFESKLSKTGLVNAVVRLEDDKLIADNSRYLALYIPKKINVTIYTANPQNAVYVKAALQNNYSGNISVEIKRPDQYSTFTADKNSVVIFIGAKGFDLQFFKKDKNLPEALIYFPAENVSENAVENLLKSLGIAVTAKKIFLNQNYLEFGNVDFSHPVFYDLFSKSKNIKIESPFIHQYIKILSGSSIKPVISLMDNSIFFGEADVKKRKILIFTVSPTIKWSNFPLKTIFAPLIERSVYYLSSNGENGKTYTAGFPININLKNIILPEIRIVSPNGRETYIPGKNFKGKHFYKYYNTFSAGIYKFYSGKKLIDFASVNPAWVESQTSYYGAKTFAGIIKKYNFYKNVIVVNNNSNLKDILAKSRFGTELWRLFLVFAFAAAIIEMLISRSSKKDLANLA